MVEALKFIGRQVAECRMRPRGVVVAPPRFDDDHGFDAVAEPVLLKAFGAKFAIEALVNAVLPWLSRLEIHVRNTMRWRPVYVRSRSRSCSNFARCTSAAKTGDGTKRCVVDVTRFRYMKCPCSVHHA